MRPHSLPLTLLLTGCPPPGGSGPGGDSGAAGPQAIVASVASDYSLGALATVALDDWSVADELAAVSGDPLVVQDGDWIFQINRGGYDNIRVYEPGRWDVPLHEFSVAGDASTNPQDVDLCDGKLFVSLYETDHLAVYDPETGILTGTVDLSAYDDGDGPEPTKLVERDGMLYVALNRMDREAWVSVGGMVVEVDCTTETATRSWKVGGNTQLFDSPEDAGLLVSAEAHGDGSEGWGQAGGLYLLDPGAEEGSLEQLVDLDAQDWRLTGAVMGDTRAILVGPRTDYSEYGVHCLDLDTGALQTVETMPEYLVSAAGDGAGEAWVAAHWGWLEPDTSTAGLRVYDIEACESLTEDSPITLSMAPYAIAFY